MPYKSNAELPESVRNSVPEHGQTIFRKAYNSAAKQYGTDNEARLMKVAWGAVKNVYEKKDEKWVLKEGKSAISDAITPQTHSHILDGWIPVAKVGQAVRMKNPEDYPDSLPVVFPTAEGFEKAVETFKESKKKGYVSKNHSEVLDGLEMLAQKFEYPFLYAKFNTEGEAAIKDPGSTGRSIDATVFGTEEYLLTDFIVPGVSVLYEPHTPACTSEMGCASFVGVSKVDTKIDFDLAVLNNKAELVKIRDVNLYLDKTQMKDEKSLKDALLGEVAYLGYETICMFLEHDPSLRIGDILPSDTKPVHTIQIAISAKDKTELEYHGGDIKKMGKEEEPVTYTGDQTKEMIASAVAEVTEKLDNAHAVEVTKLKEEGETKIKGMETEQEAAIKEAQEAAFKRATLIEGFKQKYNPSEEVLKKVEELKTPEDMLEFLNAMETPAAPGASSVGISSTSGGESDVEKIEEIGGFDARKGEFAPAFREVKK